jgi:hypothetical protein
MAGRHRTTYRKIQIMEVKTVPANEEARVKNNIKGAPVNNQQFFDAKIKFPLTHRVLRHPSKSGRTLFKAKRAGAITTHFQ